MTFGILRNTTPTDQVHLRSTNDHNTPFEAATGKPIDQQPVTMTMAIMMAEAANPTHARDNGRANGARAYDVLQRLQVHPQVVRVEQRKPSEKFKVFAVLRGDL